MTTPEGWVVDTNVLISAALSRQGSPHMLVQHLLQVAQLVFCEETFEELRSRLHRPKFDRYITRDMRVRLLHDLSASSSWVELQGDIRHWSRDRDDDKFIALALKVPGGRLVTGDHDLLDIHPVPQGLTIMTPAQALAVLGLG